MACGRSTSCGPVTVEAAGVAACGRAAPLSGCACHPRFSPLGQGHELLPITDSILRSTGHAGCKELLTVNGLPGACKPPGTLPCACLSLSALHPPRGPPGSLTTFWA